MAYRIEHHNLHGSGDRRHQVYDMAPATRPLYGAGGALVGRTPDYWAAVTSVPCPVRGCGQTVVWYEANYVPGYRVCMALAPLGDGYDLATLRHRFSADGNAERPTLIRHTCCE